MAPARIGYGIPLLRIWTTRTLKLQGRRGLYRKRTEEESRETERSTGRRGIGDEPEGRECSNDRLLILFGFILVYVSPCVL